ncbi:class I SAM-dependent methyltransferase [Phycicoccus sp. CSK15P-2]|uniref:class I SAM-dependent methyltransferase n=1 Tax=Phycicoccus sp. CSK15P-2 TaxID=2807627 RepID=UPI001951DF13|nr:class I SAM-dependent methyltransferase [Phycicoccus sp. CSK15P-2]MBM6404306.1 class I SAM-dependent methyltransferase [Phycicoccus sp. CSK15P-2]
MSHDDFVYEDDDRAEVEPFLPAGVTRVLDAGCGAGGFGRTLRRRYGDAVHVVGLEPHPEGVALARASGSYSEVVQGLFPDDVPEGGFDLVVFNDVLEHMVDPWTALAAARDLVGPDGHVVASIPNVQYLPVLWDLARHARFDYVDTGVLDRTHLRFFTWKTATDMFIRAGFDVSRVAGVKSCFTWDPWRRRRWLSRVVGTSRWMQVVIVGSPGRGGSEGAVFEL